MKKIKAIPASDGCAVGPVFCLTRQEAVYEERSALPVGEETARFEEKLTLVCADLQAAADQAAARLGEQDAEIFLVHQMLLTDEEFNDGVRALLGEGYTAEYAVTAVGSRIAEEFAALDDAYMQARAADFRDASGRLVNKLCGLEVAALPDTPVILVADELTPGETIAFSGKSLLGIATRRGSVMSHSSILARNLGIPAVAAVELPAHLTGTVILDGTEGAVILEPEEETLAAYGKRIAEERAAKDRRKRYRDAAAVTAAGQHVEVACNIGKPEDVAAVLEQGGDSIGLFRSEFLFMGRETMPTEEEQAAAYGQVLRAMGGRRVIIRTLDCGADKQIPYLRPAQEENPALGCRAIRLCLRQPEIFMTQLRALLRASVEGRLAIMLPMISQVEEVAAAKAMLEEARTQLAAEGVPFAKHIDVGIMIEVPGAALTSDLLAEHVDFFSIGTNDLTQYTLAVDRMNTDIGDLFDPGALAVRRLIRMTAENAHKKGIWVGICGESAGDLSLLPFYLETGIDELSVSPMKVLELKEAIITR